MKLSTRQRKKVQLFRVARGDDPWTWVDWNFADNHRFSGRFDDPQGEYRVLYAAATLRACLIELLAHFRPDPVLVDEMAQIVDEDDDESTVPAGTVPREWADQRRLGTAVASAKTCMITDVESVMWLRDALGLKDLDAAVLKSATHREVTQRASRAFYDRTSCAALEYASRHGDRERLWAILEREKTASPPCLSRTSSEPFPVDAPEVEFVFDLFGLSWGVDTTRSPDQDLPAPISLVDPEELRRRIFSKTGGEPTPAHPLGAFMMWSDALTTGHLDALHALTYRNRFWTQADWNTTRKIMDLQQGLGDWVAPAEGKLPRGVEEMVHVRLGWPEFAGDPDGQAYEFFGSYDSPAPMTYVALVKPSESASWLVAGLGYGCQMRAENLKKLGPRARINAELPSAT